MTTVGELRERVTFTRPQRTRRLDGGWDTVPATVGSRWAKVVPVTGVESPQAGRLRNATTYHITMRKLDGLTADATVTWNGLSLNIREVRAESERKNYQVIIAESGAVL